MNENSSQTIKEISEDQEIKNSSELNNDSESQNEEDSSFENSDIPQQILLQAELILILIMLDLHKKNLHHY